MPAPERADRQTANVSALPARAAVRRRSAIVVGAGIGGVTAAFRLQQAGWDVTILEQLQQPGGRMKTVRAGPYQIDVGAGILPASYTAVLELIADAKLDHLIDHLGGQIAIPRDGVLHMLNMNNLKLSLLTTKLIPLRSKLKLWRVTFDLWRSGRFLGCDTISGAAAFDTMTAAAYARRHLDAELLDYVVEPTMRTLYLNRAADASVIEFLWCMKNLSSNASFCIKGGMDQLTAALAKQLNVAYGSTVERVDDDGTAARVTFVDAHGARHDKRADCCILALDGKTIATLFSHGLSQAQAAYLANMRYSTSVNLHFGLSADPGVSALIVQIPTATDPDLAALVMDHLKGPGRAPAGLGLVSAFFEDGWGRRMFDATDDVILADAIPRIERVIPGFAAMVTVSHVERWRHAATITDVGQCAGLGGFEADIKPGGRILFASDLFALSSVNTCTVQGNRAARAALALV